VVIIFGFFFFKSQQVEVLGLILLVEAVFGLKLKGIKRIFRNLFIDYQTRFNRHLLVLDLVFVFEKLKLLLLSKRSGRLI
jgi:hypothetical protein